MEEIVKPVCIYFQSGYCRNGSDCRFSHEIVDTDPLLCDGYYYYESVCKFIQKGKRCPYGWNCWYYHPERDQPSSTKKRSKKKKPITKVKTDKEVVEPTLEKSTEGITNVQTIPEHKPSEPVKMNPVETHLERHKSPVVSNETSKRLAVKPPSTVNRGPEFNFDLSALSTDDIKSLRLRDMEFLKIRYKGCLVDNNINDQSTIIKVLFAPTDPDWPFDVREVTMAVVFPLRYPIEVVTVDYSDNDCIPATLGHHLTAECNKWLSVRHQTETNSGRCELVIRSFLRWLDRSIRELFIQGLRKVRLQQQAEAAGISLLLPPSQPSPITSLPEVDVTLGEEFGKDVVAETDESVEFFQANQPPLSTATASNAAQNFTATTVNRQTEVSVRRVDLTSTVGTLKATQIQLILMCSRCRHRQSEVYAIRPGQTVVVKCSKCRNDMSFAFEPCVIHSAQSGNVICWLQLDGCTAFDLVLPTAEFMANCLQCSSDNPIVGLNFGQPQTSWCRKCHSKLEILLDGIRITNVPSSGAAKITKTVALPKAQEKMKRLIKDPAIKEGQPLPDFGACKHYKKSFRWFRFPCCGKTYPCDKCHEEQEDHELKFANRVVCGYCCAEQGFAGDKPCANCKNSLTKTNSAHWEGGKGCRDTTKMSRDDRKKYAGRSKTTPKTVEPEKSKKKSKPHEGDN